MSSLDDFKLRPERAGDRLALRRGELRHVLAPIRFTGSLEVQVVLVAGDRRAVSDFEGYVLIDGLFFGTGPAEAAGQVSPLIDVARDDPEQRIRILIVPDAQVISEISIPENLS